MKQEKLNKSIDNYAHQVWLAGLGAFGKVQKEGSKLFDTLVSEGERVQARNKEAAHAQAKKMKAKAETGMDKAIEAENKLEKVFQKRVARALNWLNVATNADIQALSQQLDILSANIQELENIRKSAAKPRVARVEELTA